MAGAGEACSHVGATLFAVETAVRIRDSATCTGKSNVWLPAYNPTTEFKRLQDIDFSSSKAKKKRMDTIHIDSPNTHQPSRPVPKVPAPTPDELERCYAAIKESGANPALFMVNAKYSSNFHPPKENEPCLLRSLGSTEARTEDLPALLVRAEKVLRELKITDDMVTRVERNTREQSKCSKWYAYRAGRITASVMKSVCTTSVSQPSVSLVKRICYPEKQKFSSAATEWGLRHENTALSSYKAKAVQQHRDFRLRKTGVFLCVEYPHLAASPDSFVSCACCGDGIVEVKCPYSAADCDILQTLNSPNCSLEQRNGKLVLKRTHAYYFQIQAQIAVCRVKYCDFVVWTPTSLYTERVLEDAVFFNEILLKATRFFTHVVLPELFAEFFTKKGEAVESGAATAAYCYCRGPEIGKMLACDGKKCPYKWFHYSCIGIKRAPRQKTWFCSDCST